MSHDCQPLGGFGLLVLLAFLLRDRRPDFSQEKPPEQCNCRNVGYAAHHCSGGYPPIVVREMRARKRRGPRRDLGRWIK